MATLSIPTHYHSSSSLLILSLLTLTLTLIFKPTLSLSLQTLHNNPNFDPNLALSGDAEFIHGDSSVRLTRPSPSSSGLLIHTKPFKFVESKTDDASKPTSFSTEFVFSISPPQNGDCLALIVVPADFELSWKTRFGLSRENRVLRVEFDANRVGIDDRGLVSSRVFNSSSIDLVLNSGSKWRSWVDYEASSKRLEIRLTQLGNPRPYNPFLTYPIDLSKMWKEEEMLFGLSSSNGDSSQTSSVYSWRFRVRTVPTSMHSQPLDPAKVVHTRRFCALGVLYRAVLAAACVCLVLFTALLLQKIFMDCGREKIITTDLSLGPTDFRYEKVNVVVDSNCPFGNPGGKLGKPMTAT